jgi:hypothetical protein
MVSLKIPSYISSKLLVLGVLSALQCLVLLILVSAFSTLKAPFLATYAILLMTAVTGVAIGLFVSACARTTESAVASLPIILLPMILLGGGMKPVHELELGARSAGVVMPTRWAFVANLFGEAGQRIARFEGTPCKPVEDELVKARAACGAAPGGSAAGGASPYPSATEPADVASTHFPKQERADWSRYFAYLSGMAAFWIALLAGALKCRDIR